MLRNKILSNIKVVLSSSHKGIDPKQMISRASSMFKNNPVDWVRVNEVLWRVDDRLRPNLEKEYGSQFWKIHDAVLTEATKILLKRKDLEDLFKDRMTNHSTAQMSWQILVFEACYGRRPNGHELDKMKKVIELTNAIQASGQTKKERLEVDMALSVMCDKAFSGMSVSKRDLQNTASFMARMGSLKEIEPIYMQEKSPKELSIEH